jgi:hypothetical protein
MASGLASEFVYLLADPNFYVHLASWRVVICTPAVAGKPETRYGKWHQFEDVLFCFTLRTKTSVMSVVMNLTVRVNK